MTTRRQLGHLILATLLLAPVGSIAAAEEGGAESGDEASPSQGSAGEESSSRKKPRRLVYEGKLEGNDGKPITGIFPLRFSLHRSKQAQDALWTGTHFVAIDNGSYEVRLGESNPIPGRLDPTHLHLAVSLTSGQEIVREKIQPRAVRKGAAAGGSDSGGGGTVEYAEEAGFAYEAELANTAEAVGDVSADDLAKKLEEAGEPPELGSETRYTSSAGGDGGVSYELRCPRGYVVTGLRGGEGMYLDSVQLICSPLR